MKKGQIIDFSKCIWIFLTFFYVFIFVTRFLSTLKNFPGDWTNSSTVKDNLFLKIFWKMEKNWRNSHGFRKIKKIIWKKKNKSPYNLLENFFHQLLNNFSGVTNFGYVFVTRFHVTFENSSVDWTKNFTVVTLIFSCPNWYFQKCEKIIIKFI